MRPVGRGNVGVRGPRTELAHFEKENKMSEETRYPAAYCTPSRETAITVMPEVAMGMARQLNGVLVPIYQRAIQATTGVPFEVQGALCSEAMAAVTREKNEIALQGSLTAIYCLAVRWAAGGNIRQGLQGELLSTLMREESPDAIRGSLIVIYSLAAFFSLSWDAVIEPAQRLYPYVARKSLADELAASLRC